MRRVGFAGCGSIAAIFAITSALRLLTTNYHAVTQTEGRGITAMLTVSAGWIAATFLLAALGRIKAASGVDLALRSFGFGWIVGDVINVLAVVTRGPFPQDQGLNGLLLDVFSLAVVTLIFAVPGLFALTLARLTDRDVSQ